MPSVQLPGERIAFLPRSGLARLISAVREEGYTLLGPRVVGRVVGLRPIESVGDLAAGVRDEQEGGRYRLLEGDPGEAFGCANGQDSPKSCFFPSKLPLFRLRGTPEQLVVESDTPTPPKLAFLGIRPCDLAAVLVQDRTFLPAESGAPACLNDPYYQEARREALFIPVNCTRPGNTCFCASMGTGPTAREGFDLALTELRAGFVVQVGSPRGRALLEKLPARSPSSAERELAEARLEAAVGLMGRRLDTEGLPERLAEAIEHPRWDEVAERCLGCGNCTLVCPTCFCSTVVDSTGLEGEWASRARVWESCYTFEFSYTVAGPVRTTVRGRYRQWLRHKLSTWYPQFGVSGCVGCGRCITWCPVGIDLTEESAAICSQR